MTITLDELITLPDDAFNRAVAEMEGYCLIATDDGFGLDIVFMRPNGNPYHPGCNVNWAEHEFSEFVPDYAKDLNAAWALCCELFGATIQRHGDGHTCRLLVDGQHWHEGSTKARALTTAWYAWKLAGKGEA